MCMCICVHECMCAAMCHNAYLKVKAGESFLFLHHMGSGSQTLVIRMGGKHAYPLSHLIGLYPPSIP